MKVFVPLALLAGFSNGFQTTQRPASVFQRSSPKLAVTPEHLNDVHSVLTDSHAWTYLADAAAATLNGAGEGSLPDALQGALEATETAIETAAQAEADVAADDGLWQAYLNLFKGALLFVHDTIDEPLKNAGISHSWGISIALFTAGVRSLLVPLSSQQSKSSEYMKALKPYVAKVREKYKDNKDQMNRAIGKLYEDANQNPLAGCFVSLAQLPIFLGLYRAVRLLAQEGNLDEPFLWIPSLQGPVSAPDYRGLDWLITGWSNGAPQLGWETTIAFLIMPVVLVLGQSLSMSVLTPPMDDDMGEEEKEQMEKSQVVLKFLPLLIGFFSLQAPAGLSIYWFVSNGFTLLQSLIVKAYYKANPPEIELPDYWDALDDVDTMTAEEKREAAKAGLAVGPKFEDLLEEASFHVLVDRKPIRVDSAAWQRIVKSESMDIPSSMKSWVDATSSTSKSEPESVLEKEPAEATA